MNLNDNLAIANGDTTYETIIKIGAEIDQLFKMLGEKHYLQIKDSPSTEDFEIISKLNSLFSDLNDFENALKNQPVFEPCTHCLSELQINSNFCNTCGKSTSEEIVEEAIEEIIVTPIVESPISETPIVEALVNPFETTVTFEPIPIIDPVAVEPSEIQLTETAPVAEPEPVYVAPVIAVEEPQKAESITCPTCSYVLGATDMFCTNCGQKIEEPTPPVEVPIEELIQANVCPKCKNEVLKGDLFCFGCGHKLSEPEKPVEVAPQVVIKSCANCDYILAEGDIFCTKCGTRA